MALQKNSPLTPFLRMSVKKMLDSGIMKRIVLKYYRNIGDTSTCNTKTTEKSLSLKKLVIVFMVFICGMILSLIGMCLEYLYEKVWPNQQDYVKKIFNIQKKPMKRNIV